MTSRKLVTWLLLAPLAALIVGIGSCESLKAYYDWRLKAMCAEDGGANVYERMPISQSAFDAIFSGQQALPDESNQSSTFPAFIRRNDKTLREGYLSIGRMETQIVRKADGKILGSAVFYARSGGDFPFTGSARSYFQCPKRADLERKVFFVGGEVK